MTTSSSTARRTIDVTYKRINREKSSRFAYIRAHARASEQGLSFASVVRVILVTSTRKSLHIIERMTQNGIEAIALEEKERDTSSSD